VTAPDFGRRRFAELYDVFVDWPGRLGRELPGLTASLRAAGAQRVLDAGCGTGRHVEALLGAGFDAHGADASEEMLARARAHLGAGAEGRFHRWRMGEEPPPEVRALAPFDAIVCLGNVWTSLRADAELAAALAAFRALLAPGGLVLVGLKAVAIRRATHSPYLPLLRRTRGPDVLFFVRFVDFAGAPAAPGEPDLCDFHMTVLRGDAGAEEREALSHDVNRWRVWSPETLTASFRGAGFADVRVSASLGDPGVEPSSEDVFVHARAPRSAGSGEARA
jgi:SAM-dependent methyltransferase